MFPGTRRGERAGPGYYGGAAVLQYLQQVPELSAGTQQVVPVDLLVGRDHVAAVVDLSGQRRGLVLRDRAVQLPAFRDRLIVMRRVYPADQAAFDRFWAPDRTWSPTVRCDASGRRCRRFGAGARSLRKVRRGPCAQQVRCRDGAPVIVRRRE